MKTKKDYYHIKSKAKLPAALMSYTVEKNGVVRLGHGSFIVDLDEDEKNIAKMEQVEREEGGFMFWHGSEDSEQFFKINGESIANFFIQALDA